jgi:nucleotide-binding universal stress UspA family protein
MKILLAVDGSKYSLDAVKFMIEHTDWYRDKPIVDLVHVHLPVPSFRGMSKVISKSDIQQYYQEEGEAALAEAKKILDAARIEYTAHILVGPIAETLTKHAEKAHCEFILIGTHGRSSVGAMLLGSVALKLLHIATVPVLLVR